MDIKEIQKKLEFDKIQDKLRNYCYSPLGAGKIDDIETFYSRTALIKEFDKLRNLRSILDAGDDIPLDGLKDIRDSLELIRISGNYLQPDKFIWIKDFLTISRLIKSRVTSFFETENELTALAANLYSDRILEHNIDSIVDASGTVKDTASKDLKKIRSALIEKRDTLRKSLSKLLNRVSEQEYSQDDIITLRDGRSVIPVKVENKRKVPGIIHSSSSTGYTVFIEPAETIELNNEITELYFEEKREVEKVLRYLSEDISKYYYELKVNCDILGELDFVRAKAKYAVEYDCSEPQISTNKISYIKAYHPLLLQKFGVKEIVPLEFSVKEGINTIVITGPNAGGKTVALKTVGILQLMLQSGMFVPAFPDSEFRIFDKMYVVIGDEQSIENSLSSFSSHLKELKDVISNAGSESLVLIDEICSGTDPKFGSALAASILKDFSDKNAFTIVTTHIGDLKVFAHNNEKFENASLEFDFDRLAPSFRFQMGIPGQSYTFELSRKFNIPERIIEYAASFIAGDQHKLEDILVALNKNKNKLEEQARDFESKNKELDKIINDYDAKFSDIKSREKEILKDAKSKAGEIVDKGRALIEKTIKDIREKEKSVSEIKKEYKKESDKLKPEIKPENKVEKTFAKGDIVMITDTLTRGEILEIDGDNAILNTNGMIFKTKLNLLTHVDSKKEKKDSDYKIILKESFIPRLDIRGKYSNEIEELLENFIYEGQINSMNELTVVHGKGSGTLRKTVHDIIKKNKIVKSFRLGNWNEGDTGVTIIELKN
ncbi:MAG: endonuclease MutS2 [Ignavibacteria bacterium]|nr:endonuclease MutS2 [Ignavibacteria bacterium]